MNNIRIARSVRTAVGLSLAATVVLSISACAAPDPGTASAEKDSAVILLSAAPATLDPALSSDTGRVALRFVYDPLLHRVDDETVSGLADEWEITSTQADFHIRDGVTCSDGEPLTAETVAKNLDRIKDPAVGAPLTSTYLGTTDYEVSFDAAANTVSLTLAQPTPFLERSITDGPLIVCDAALDDPTLIESASLGSGPYVIESAGAGAPMVVTKREGYAWGAGGATNEENPATIEFRETADYETQANILITGDADAALLIGASLDRVEESTGRESEIAVQTSTGIVFNERTGLATSDQAVRVALTQALDRGQYATISSDGFGSPLNSVLGDRSACFSEDQVKSVPSGGADAAAKTLEEAGWSKNASGIYEKDGAPLTVRVLLFGTSASGAELVRDEWSTLGVDAIVDSRPVGEASSVLFAGQEWDAAFIGLARDIPVTNLFSGPSSEEGGFNFGSVQNTEFNQLVASANAQVGDASCPDFIAAEQALLAAADWVPLVVDNMAWASPSLQFNSSNLLINPTSIRFG